jgi:hypothetical protein
MRKNNGEIKIRKVEFLYANQPSRRKIKVLLTNGGRIYIEPCCESWEQYGGTTNELYITMPIAEKYNAWLHGEGDLVPDEDFDC